MSNAGKIVTRPAETELPALADLDCRRWKASSTTRASP
jgi:hypothetical protein